MRKLIVQQWVTVDNIAAEEDGGLSFVSGEPFSETTNPAFKASVMGFIDSVDTMILGANTYAMSKDYWPNADDQGEYGEKLNNLTKYVASSTSPVASRECMSVKLPHSQMSLPFCPLISRMVAAGSRVTVAAGKSPQGASSSFDEAMNLVRLLSFSPYSPWSSAFGQ